MKGAAWAGVQQSSMISNRRFNLVTPKCSTVE
jgi:hypothetical protein